MTDRKCPVIVVFAPTACGKTALIQNLFGQSSLSSFKGRGEVISADSQAVYIGMDIGTAKPTEEENNNVPHHLINLVTPDVQFGVGEFIKNADELCQSIYSRGKVPIIVGGTGFYIRNFILGLPVTPESDPIIREQLKERIKREGKETLYAELEVVDSISAKKININDEYRICRALEVFYSSGKPLSSYKLPDKPRSQYDFCTIILNRQKEDLYNRIDLRVDQMMNNGLYQEFTGLLNQGYTEESPGMKAIGYREFFDSDKSLDEIAQSIKLNSRHYAKKQYTFMRDIPEGIYLNAEDTESITKVISNFMDKIRFS